MASVNLEINGQRFQIGCDDGQEQHLTTLAYHFDSHIRSLTKHVGRIGEQKLFLMAALMIADETFELQKKLDEFQGELKHVTDIYAENEANLKKQLAEAEAKLEDAAKTYTNLEQKSIETLDEVARIFSHTSERIENISKALNEV